MNKNTLNGSLYRLAMAMRDVFTEAVQEGVEPVNNAIGGIRKDMTAMEGRLNKKIDDGLEATNKMINEGLKTTNKNVQGQLAQNRKDISADVKEAIEGC